MTDKKTEKPIFLVDTSVLIGMIKGDEDSKSKELMNKLKQFKDEGKDIQVITPLSCLLRAIWLSEPDIPIKNLQKIISFCKIMPSFSDFKVEKDVFDETIKIAGIFSGASKNKRK